MNMSRSQNKNTDFFMTLAWLGLCRFNFYSDMYVKNKE